MLLCDVVVVPVVVVTDEVLVLLVLETEDVDMLCVIDVVSCSRIVDFLGLQQHC